MTALTILLFFAGFYILIKGSDVLVKGAVAIARRFNISNIVIGLAIVGIGTSIPELSISFLANLTGESSIGLGTIIGSNTFNILFILGLSALLFPLTLKDIWVKRDLMWNMLAVLLAIALSFDGNISRGEGIALIIVFVIWILGVARENNGYHADPGEEKFGEIALPIAFFMIVAGIAGAVLGGKWVVDGAEIIALSFGISERIVGLTIVGIGTSMPELAVTAVAAFRKHPGIAVGNIIGSNIFDFLMILGISAAALPLSFPPALYKDITVTLGATILLYILMFTGKKNTLKRFEGFILLSLYIGYLAYTIF